VPAQLKICPQCGNEYELDQRFCPKDGSTLKAQGGSDGNLVGQIIADRYHIVQKLGEGGMGQVYLSQHVRMKRKSAVKVMNPGMVHDPDAISRFNREAENASQIAHPNVAAIYDFGETSDGLIYLAMEFIEGEPLTKTLKTIGALPASRAANIAKQVADGLSAAHDLGIVHRDLKPDNIMIAKARDGSDQVKIVDFGIAKAMESNEQKVTRTGLSIGTPEYMSPEQLAGDKLDHRTDIYSLGLVAFSMFTGHLPFPSVTSKEALIMRLTDRPRTLAQIRTDIAWPAALQTVMDRALANDADERYQKVADFGRDILRAVELMPAQDLTSQGTVEFAIPNSQTQPIGSVGGGMTAGGTKILAGSKGKPVPDVGPDDAKVFGHGKLYAGLGTLVAAAAVGGWFFLQSQKKPETTAPIAAPVATAPAVVPDSGAPAVADSTAGTTPAATVTDSTPAPADTRTATASSDTKTQDSERASATIRQAAETIRGSIREGRDFLNDSDYELAALRFQTAQDALTPLVRNFPKRPEVQTLRNELRTAITAAKTACDAERRLALRDGETPPECRF
jgi:serine/threonine protein kinase